MEMKLNHVTSLSQQNQSQAQLFIDKTNIKIIQNSQITKSRVFRFYLNSLKILYINIVIKNFITF